MAFVHCTVFGPPSMKPKMKRMFGSVYVSYSVSFSTSTVAHPHIRTHAPNFCVYTLNVSNSGQKRLRVSHKPVPVDFVLPLATVPTKWLCVNYYERVNIMIFKRFKESFSRKNKQHQRKKFNQQVQDQCT